MDAAFNPLTTREVAALLAGGPFAEAWSRGAALTLSGGDPLRLVYASPAALTMFGAQNPEALNSALHDAASPGARRLGQLAHRLSVGDAPRLEQLRFFRGRLPFAFGLICARIAGNDGATYLIAVSPTHASGNAPEPEPMPEVADASEDESPAAPFQALPIDSPVRFVWKLDASDSFAAIDPALIARLGPNAPHQGETLAKFLTRVPIDPADAWSAAVAERATFSQLHLEWTEPGGAPRARDPDFRRPTIRS